MTKDALWLAKTLTRFTGFNRYSSSGQRLYLRSPLNGHIPSHMRSSEVMMLGHRSFLASNTVFSEFNFHLRAVEGIWGSP